MEWRNCFTKMGEIVQMNTLYTVQKINNKDKLYGNTHGSHDGQSTVCGKQLDCYWYITDNTFTGIITCKKCLQILKENN